MLIYIIDADERMRERTAKTVKYAGYEVREFASAQSVMQAYFKERPSMVIIDPKGMGEQFSGMIKELRLSAAYENLYIIVLTEIADELLKVKAFDTGADEYLIKPTGVLELTARLKAAARRIAVQPTEELLRCGNIHLCGEKHMIMQDERPLELTCREYELLAYLMRNRGIVVTRERVMDKVWVIDYAGGSRTVDAHIKAIRQKLGADGERIKTVRGVGYMLE